MTWDVKAIVDGVVKNGLEAYDSRRQEIIEPLLDIGTPRQLEGKVSEWTPEQHQKLQQLFHKAGPEVIDNCEYCQAVAEESIKNMHENEQGEA